MTTSRRRLLAALSTGILATGTGCSGVFESDTRTSTTVTQEPHSTPASPSRTEPPTSPSSESAQPETTEDTETTTQEPLDPPTLEVLENQAVDVEYSRDLDQHTRDSIPEAHRSVLEAGNLDDFSKWSLELTRNGETTRVEPENTRFSLQAPVLAPETQVKVQGQKDHDVKTSEPVTITKNTPSTYQADLKTVENQNIGAWNTIYRFDNHVHNQNEMKQRRNDWNTETMYNELIPEINQVEEKERKWEGSNYGYHFSNAGEETRFGYWTIDNFQSLNNAQDILTDARNVTEIWQLHQGMTRYSTENDHAAATIEHITNNLYEPESEQRKVTTTNVQEGGHGTIMAYIHEDSGLDTEFTSDGESFGEHNWWFIDTTDNQVMPINSDEIYISNGSRGDYNPFIEGYQGDRQVSEFNMYETEKLKAEGPLLETVHRNDQEDLGYEITNISLSDPVLETIFNEHVPEGGSIKPMQDLAEKAIDLQIDTEEYIQVYGDNITVEQNQDGEKVFDGIKYAIGDQQLYEKSMDDEITLTEETVETHLEPA